MLTLERIKAYKESQNKLYSRGKIYKIEGNGKIYVGSTIHSLERRLKDHRSKDNKCMSRECISDPNHTITLLEEVCCSSKKELEIAELIWYYKIDCINKRKPTSAILFDLKKIKLINMELVNNDC